MGERTQIDLKIGCQTVDVENERFLERNGYRNTINSLNEAHLRMKFFNGNQFEALLVAPVRAQPRDFESFASNRQEFDKTDDTTRFWGLIYTDDKNWIHNTKSKVFGYALHERDYGANQILETRI